MADEPFEVQPQYGSNDWIDDLGIPREKRFSRPRLPHPKTGEMRVWTRASTIAKTLDDTFNLDLWKQRMVAKGVASRRDLTNRAATTDMSDRNAWIEICDMALEYAGGSEGRNNGTALHAVAETYDKDPTGFDPSLYPDELMADLYAYIDACKRAQILMAPDLVERTTVNSTAGLAGTWDRVGFCRHWPLPRVVDLKTQKTIDYSQTSICIQVTGYATGDVMLPKPWPGLAGTKADYLAMPQVDTRRGVVIHVPVGKAEAHIYEIDLEAGLNALKTALSVRRWRSRKDLFVQVPIDLSSAVSGDLSGPRSEPKPAKIPTSRHNKPEPPQTTPVTVPIDDLAQAAGDPAKMRDLIRQRIREANGKQELASLFTMYGDHWTDDMTELGKDRLRVLAGKQPIGPPF